jgi:cytochrome P450
VRRCLGATFATLEMRVVLRTVLANMDLRAATRRPASARRRVVTLIPSNGSRIIAEPMADDGGRRARTRSSRPPATRS